MIIKKQTNIHMYVYNYYFKGNQLNVASDFHIHRIYIQFLNNRYFFYQKSGFDFLFQILKNESWDSFETTRKDVMDGSYISLDCGVYFVFTYPFFDDRHFSA